MAKANQYHRAGNSFKKKSKEWNKVNKRDRKAFQKNRIKEKRSGWWKRKFRSDKNGK